MREKLIHKLMLKRIAEYQSQAEHVVSASKIGLRPKINLRAVSNPVSPSPKIAVMAPLNVTYYNIIL